MAAVSLAGRSDENNAPPSHAVPPSCAKIAAEPGKPSSTKREAVPDEAGGDLCRESIPIEVNYPSRLSEVCICTVVWCVAVTKRRKVPADARRLVRHWGERTPRVYHNFSLIY